MTPRRVPFFSSTLVLAAFISCICGMAFTAAADVPGFKRGDANCDTVVNNDDLPALQAVINSCLAGACNGCCLDAADVNDDGIINGSDLNMLQAFLGGGGPPPRAPGPFVCGPDPTPDAFPECKCGGSGGPGTETCNGVDDDGDGLVDEGFSDRDGDHLADCIDQDDDGDGIPDGSDNCPLTNNPAQADDDGNGIGNDCQPSGPPILNPPSPISITTDGQFGPPTAEWFGVTPAEFQSGNFKVYVGLDPVTDAIFLMYDISTSTTSLGLGERAGPISFQVGAGSFFDVFFIQGGPNTGHGPNPVSSDGGAGDAVEVFLNGSPFDNSSGCVVGAVDHNSTSPNFATAHNLFELEVRLTGFPGGCYSPEPAFWSATLPTVAPTPPGPTLLAGEPTPSTVSVAFVSIDAEGNTSIFATPDAFVGVESPRGGPGGVLRAAPNPFTDQTSMVFSLPVAQKVELIVYDLAGRIVWRAPATAMEAGTHQVSWSGEDMSGRRVGIGTYFVRLRGDDGLDLRGTVVRLR